MLFTYKVLCLLFGQILSIHFSMSFIMSVYVYECVNMRGVRVKMGFSVCILLLLTFATIGTSPVKVGATPRIPFRISKPEIACSLVLQVFSMGFYIGFTFFHLGAVKVLE